MLPMMFLASVHPSDFGNDTASIRPESFPAFLIILLKKVYL
jgi:hypothetical protein